MSTRTHVTSRRRAARAFLSAPGALFAVLTLTGLLVLAVLAPALLSDYAGERDFMSASQGPSWTHLFGTDALGRDVAARTLVATRLSLGVAVAATAIGSVCGVLLGAGLALSPAAVRSAGARAIDGMLAFPSVLMGIFVAAILGPGTFSAVTGIGVALIPHFARITLTKALTLISEDYVRAAAVMGVPRRRIITRHLLPNLTESVGVVTLVTVGEATIAVSSLSFLGLGVQAPDYDWGQLLTNGIASFQLTPFAAIAPAIMITLVGISTGLVGDGLARALNPARQDSPARPRLFGTTLLSRKRPARARAKKATQPTPLPDTSLLSVRDLVIEVDTPTGPGWPVRGVSLDIAAGEMVGIVGESGSGKTMTAMALAGLLDTRSTVTANGYRFADTTTPTPSDPAAQPAQRDGIAVVFQDPMSSFNPLLRVGTQIGEAAQAGLGRADRKKRVEELLEAVQVSAPAHRMRQFPHELSGGMRQRAMIASALLSEPDLIVADEPTTSLDVTVQAQILSLLRDINNDGVAVLLISHDIALVAQNCHRILVMYAGSVVEELPADRVLDASHPYTRSLIAATPALGEDNQAAGAPGEPPAITSSPTGCPFADRCTSATDKCRTEAPQLTGTLGNRVACWHPHPRRDT